ncbi:hypothetical protein PPERSA_09509 [Pseudocohnilembus persalinus]|uniref:40S ribosomal protein S8 n=1 Tax=Pseudocohnilembus persalinus TaxID=266149 RepID=A0A0V0QFE2_PSEPJ|nr:hypothetical protein PPERSA_09509 [Pseudocohnilembus persalinus]|eukprot:KRX00903.1 hypothetical protein PPERSA_09509 [Pseudocohnilembus persalinus]
MGISRDSRHKRRLTGGRMPIHKKKRAFEKARPAANTKLISDKNDVRVRYVRTRGGNRKFRALRLVEGNFSWGSENISRKTKIIDVAYNASNNELVRTKTLVKNAIVVIDGTPFRQWYQQHYGIDLGKKGGQMTDEKRSKKIANKLAARGKGRTLEPKLEHTFLTNRIYACISSRPGQSGRADGYILEGRELEFYARKIEIKKNK